MIGNVKGWHYTVVKTLLTLLKGTTSKHEGDFCYLNRLHILEQGINLNHIKKCVL